MDKESLDRRVYEFPADVPLPKAFIEWAFGGYDALFKRGPIDCWNEKHGEERFYVSKIDNAYCAINRILAEWDRMR